MNILVRRKPQRTTIICAGLTSLVIGLFASFHGFTINYSLLAIALLLAFVAKKLHSLKLIVVILVAGALGVWRGNSVHIKLQHYDPLYGRMVSMQGTVADDPGYNQEKSQTEFHVSSLRQNSTRLPGKVMVALREDPHVTRGDVVIVSGRLRPSKGTARQGSINQAAVKIVHKNTSKPERVRQQFFKSVHTAIPEPYAALGLGYLVGSRVSIPKELSDQLALVGLTHIIAVSGYNLTVIVQAVRTLLGKKSAYQSVLFSLLLITGFIFIAGTSAPIARAAVVCGASLLGWYYGRELKPALVLLLSGAVTAFLNPLYVWGDPGWYLSFLAFAGVLIIAPLITVRYFSKKPPGTILQIFIETLCAQAVTIPYVLYLFGGVSVIAPVANIVVLPFIPFVMFMIFIVGLVGMVFQTVALYVGFIPAALLTFQVWLIKVLSGIPGAHAEVTISATTMAVLFTSILYVVLVLNYILVKKKKLEIQKTLEDLL